MLINKRIGSFLKKQGLGRQKEDTYHTGLRSTTYNVTLVALRLIPGSPTECTHKFLPPGAAQAAEALQGLGWSRQQLSPKLQGSIVKVAHGAEEGTVKDQERASKHVAKPRGLEADIARPACNRHRREKKAEAGGSREETSGQFFQPPGSLSWMAFSSFSFLLVEAHLIPVPGSLSVHCGFSEAIFHQYTCL